VQDDAWGEWASSFASDRVYQLVGVLHELALEKNCTTSQLALAWVMQRPAVISPIIGPRTSDHLKDNLGALEISLSAEEIERIEQSTSPAGALFEN